MLSALAVAVAVVVRMVSAAPIAFQQGAEAVLEDMPQNTLPCRQARHTPMLLAQGVQRAAVTAEAVDQAEVQLLRLVAQH
jgi:hypothetical protein